MNIRPALNAAIAGLSLYSVFSGIRAMRNDFEDYQIAKEVEGREAMHRLLHTEESGILYPDYLARIQPAVAYLSKFRDEGRPDRRQSRKVYHSQMAGLTDIQLATLFAAGLAAEHYGLDYYEIFKEQKLVFKSYQCRYVLPEELHTDAYDQFKMSFSVDELIEVERYIGKVCHDHSKRPICKFIVKHKAQILDELRYLHSAAVESDRAPEVAVVA